MLSPTQLWSQNLVPRKPERRWRALGPNEVTEYILEFHGEISSYDKLNRFIFPIISQLVIEYPAFTVFPSEEAEGKTNILTVDLMD